MSKAREFAANILSGNVLTVVLAFLYPTVFVLSQNWYALPASQIVWLLAMAVAAGLVGFVVIKLGALALHRLITWWTKKPADAGLINSVVFGLAGTAIIFQLLLKTLLLAAHNNRVVLGLAFAAVAAIVITALRRGAQKGVNAFLLLLTALAGMSWALSTTDKSGEWIASVRQDFETARFKHKPNVYLFIFDAYGSDDVYRKLFKFDNTPHYDALKSRGFKLAHTFSNYTSTLQTTISVFLGEHHYYSTETGFLDTQKGRPLLAGMIHNPTLQTFKDNGYKLQYVHSLDYFVNQQGILDYMYPDKPLSSALRVFDLRFLEFKRKISIESQEEALFARIDTTDKDADSWFTFGHVNLPAHAPPRADWRDLAPFEQEFRDKTQEANAHMLKIVDRIQRSDPEAVIIIFGDHGARRYSTIARDGEPNASFAANGLTAEKATLDHFGILIAIASAGRCDSYVYDSITPVNMMRNIFACLSEEQSFGGARAADISLFRNKEQEVFLGAKDGRVLPAWEPFTPPPTDTK